MILKNQSYERLLELERSNSAIIQRESNEKIKELKEKEKALASITVTNSKLMTTLEILKKDVDEKFDKVSFKQVSEKMKPVKENPIDIVLKVKEKELKNTMSLLEIMKKDNENLKRAMNEQINIVSYIDIQNKLKFKETQIQELNNEIKLLSRSTEEHNKCNENKKEFENEKKNLKDEIKKQKELVRDFQFKLKEEEAKHSKTKDNLINQKRQVEASNRNLLINKVNPGSNNQSPSVDIEKIRNLNHEENIAEVISHENNQDNKNAKEVEYISSERKSNNVNSKIFGLRNKNVDKLKVRDFSLNAKMPLKRKLDQEANNKERLFNSEEKITLEKIFSNEDIEKFEKKYEFLEHSKQATENKMKLEIKTLQKKLVEKEEQFDYLSLQFKESEQKNKILQFQVNEYKNEQKVLHRKINDLQTNLKNLYTIIRENYQENKLLNNQLTNLRKLVKHNAVPPMDSEVVKHLEKIRKSNLNEEEFIVNSTDNIIIKDMDKISNIETDSVKGRKNSIKLDDSNLLDDNTNNYAKNQNVSNINIGEINKTQNSQLMDNDINNESKIDKSQENLLKENDDF
jgi:hypothetical protein